MLTDSNGDTVNDNAPLQERIESLNSYVHSIPNIKSKVNISELQIKISKNTCNFTISSI